jgi:hypothetical protein
MTSGMGGRNSQYYSQNRYPKVKCWEWDYEEGTLESWQWQKGR